MVIVSTLSRVLLFQISSNFRLIASKRSFSTDMSASLCDHLRQIHSTAVKSVNGDTIVGKIISFNKGIMTITRQDGVKKFDLNGKEVYLLGSGKGVLGLCLGFLKALENQNGSEKNLIRVTKGIISIPTGMKCDQLDFLAKHNITTFFGAKNNLPDEDSVVATNAILDLVDNVTKKEARDKPKIFITLITGGASALLVAPREPLTLPVKRELTRTLMAAGCTINDLNTVRSCWSKVKAGQLAMKVLSGSKNVKMINLIASDVIGDPMDIIGSGPTVLPPKDAMNPLEIIDMYKIQIDQSIRDLCQLVKPSADITERLHNLIIISNRIALEAVSTLMNQLDYRIIDLGNQISGEASTLGSRFAQIARTSEGGEGKICWIGGGETVVTLTSNHGEGGRCQEMALQFLVDTYNDQLDNFAFLAGGTDGQDGPTPISGVIYKYSDRISSDIYNAAKEHLANHDSYTFWSKYLPECMIDTSGPTGVNVMDIYCLLQC